MSLRRPLISFLKLKEISNLLLCCVYLQMCTLAVVCVCRVWEPLSWSSSLLPPWVPGIQPRSSGLCSKCFQVLSQVTHLLECLFVKTCFRVCVSVCLCAHASDSMYLLPWCEVVFLQHRWLVSYFCWYLDFICCQCCPLCFHKVQTTLCSQL